MEARETHDDPLAPPTRGETLVPAMAVSAVAVVAVAAAVMVKHAEQAGDLREPQAIAHVDKPVQNAQVVTAPPLKSPATNSMGAAPACADCGVVQSVVAVYAGDPGTPRAFQMHIRMDDGSVRTVEQRGALAAGSRVVVDGHTVRPM